MLAPPSALDPARHDCLVIGPGLGIDSTTEAEVHKVWSEFPRPVVGDADALTLLAKTHSSTSTTDLRVITPHSAEAARLLETSRAAVEEDRFKSVSELCSFGIPVLKGPNTLIGGTTPWIVPVRCGKLATAGSGDILAGLIGGLIAAGSTTPRQAAAIGAWRHAHAGKSMPLKGTASDLIDMLR